MHRIGPTFATVTYLNLTEPYLVFQKCNFLKAFVGLFVLVFLKYQYVGERDHYNTYVNVINSDKKYFTMPRV